MEYIIFKVVICLFALIIFVGSCYWLTTSMYDNPNYLDIQNLRATGKRLNLARLNNKMVVASIDSKSEKLISEINPTFYSLVDGRIKPILSTQDSQKIQRVAKLQQAKQSLANDEIKVLEHAFNQIANKKFGTQTALDILNYELQNPEAL